MVMLHTEVFLFSSLCRGTDLFNSSFSNLMPSIAFSANCCLSISNGVLACLLELPCRIVILPITCSDLTEVVLNQILIYYGWLYDGIGKSFKFD